MRWLLVFFVITSATARTPLEEARALIESGRFDQAARLLDRAVVPDTAQSRGEAGVLFLKLSRYEDAVRQYGRAAQLAPDDPRYSMGVAEALTGWGRFRVALDFLVAVQSKFSALPEYHYNLGMAYYGLNNFAAALACFQKAVTISPNLDMAHFFVGNSHASMGALETALPHYRRALELNAAHPGYYVALGKVLSRLGPEREAEALQCFEKALELKPDDVPAKFYLGREREKAGDLQSARVLLEQVAQRFPEEHSPHAVLARIYYRLNERQKGDRESAIARKLLQSRKQPMLLEAPSQ